jgi:hypothetical protein
MISKASINRVYSMQVDYIIAPNIPKITTKSVMPETIACKTTDMDTCGLRPHRRIHPWEVHPTRVRHLFESSPPGAWRSSLGWDEEHRAYNDRLRRTSRGDTALNEK